MADDIIQIDVVSSVPDAAPVLQDDDTQAPLDLIRQADSWLHTVTFGGADVLKRFDISVSGTNGSTAPRIEVDYPYFINGTVSVIVESDPQVDVDANAVQALYAVDITGMTEQELIDFNAKARAIATQRIAHLNGSFDQSSVWDVQADYKYLESAVAMAQGLHVAPDASVLKAEEWMRDAIDEKADVVQTAVTTVNAKKVVDDVDNQWPLVLTLLLRNILAEKDCSTQEPHLEAYKKLYLAVGAGPDRDRVDSITKVSYADILSAEAHCVAQDAKQALNGASSEQQSAVAARTGELLDALDQEKAASPPKPALAHITSDALVLRALRSQLVP